MSLRGVLAYSGVAAFCGLLLLGMTVGARELGAGTAAGVLTLAAALGLFAFARFAGRRLVWRLDWAKVIAGAVLAGAALAGTMLAMARIGVALTAFVLSTIPVFACLGAQMRGRARLTGLTALGLGLGILGLFLVAAAPIGDPSWRFIAGVLYAVTTAVGVGVSGRWLTSRVEHDRAVEHGVASLLVAAAGLFCLAPFTPPAGSPWWTIPLAGLGAVCGLILLVAMSEVAGSLPRVATATLPGVGTVLAALGGVLVLGEQVSPVEWLGAVLILAGMALLSEPLLSLLPSSGRR
ncbi:MAG: DMT family transporter [Propionibacteriaceae bacterium]|nr:DMT family transporter [Propionibacteriaceae bacterium]